MATWQNGKLTKWKVGITASWQNDKLENGKLTKWQIDKMAN